MRVTLRLVAVVATVGAIGAGLAIGAAITAPARAELAADAIPIGSGLGRTWHLGGFSDLYPKGASGKEFTSITDRGPNLDAGTGAAAHCPQTTPVGTKVYPVPGFTPEILHLGLKEEELRVKERVPLRFPNGPAVGFSVRPAAAGTGGRNEISVDGSCAPLGTSPYGIDSEGIVEDPRDGSYWVADEYLPSVMHVLADGTVVTRVVPTGTTAFVAGTGATVVAAFPETVGTSFRTNRGFEGIAISDDGATLYIALQSPMDYRTLGSERPSPNPRNSLALRVFRLDISDPGEPAVTAQWIYPLDKASGNGPLADKVSTLIWLGVDRLAVEERDDPANDPNDNPQNTVNTRLYLADFATADAIAPASHWNGAGSGGKTLEQWYVPGQTGLPADLPTPAKKCEWVNVAKALVDAGFTDPTLPTRAGNGKIEGVAYVPAHGRSPGLLAVLNDNDFGLVVPIREQLDVLPAPGPCTIS